MTGAFGNRYFCQGRSQGKLGAVGFLPKLVTGARMTTGIFFGSTTRTLRVGDVIETFGGTPATGYHRDRGTVVAVEQDTRRVAVEFDGDLIEWKPAWGSEAKGHVHVVVFMERGDPRLSPGAYDQALAVHGEVQV